MTRYLAAAAILAALTYTVTAWWMRRTLEQAP